MVENFSNNSEPVYYKNSGGVPVVGCVLMLAIGVALALVLAYPYAWITDINPVIFINALVAFGVGTLFAVVIENAGKQLKVHNPLIYIVIALIVAAVFIYAQWAAYISINFSRNPFNGFLELLMNPGYLWGFINKVNHQGLWGVGSTVPTGILLWIIWLAEAGIVCFMSLASTSFVNANPFSKVAHTWMTRVTSFADLQSVSDSKGYVASLENGDISALMNLELAPDTDPNFAELSWFTAENAPDMYFTLQNVVIVVKNNKPEIKRKPVFTLLRVSAEQGAKIVKSVEALEKIQQEREQAALDAEDAELGEE